MGEAQRTHRTEKMMYFNLMGALRFTHPTFFLRLQHLLRHD
jgi:hypothetical protein